MPRTGAGVPVPVRTAGERVPAEIWAEALGVEEAGVTDRFFGLGGDSLRAIQVLACFRSRMSVEAPAATSVTFEARQLPRRSEQDDLRLLPQECG